MEKSIVIYGAGKIGRGFVADVFVSGGYRPLFVDNSKSLIQALHEQQKYTIYNVRSLEEQEKKIISSFDVMHSDDAMLPEKLQKIGLVAVVVFPDAFVEVASLISFVVQKKYVENDHTPLDIIVLANVVSPQKMLREKVYESLPNECKPFADEILGVVGTLVIRVAVQATDEMKAEDPLAVLTDGHTVLPIESGFKGARPDCNMLEYHETLEVLEILKLYTYNMAHAATAYLGSAKGYQVITDALCDPEIEQVVRGALDEITRAFINQYGFSKSEMKNHCDGVVKKFKNPLLEDTIKRVGANPIRKLGYSERLIGAAMMVRRNGLYPYYLLKAAAYGYLFSPPEDPASEEISKSIKKNGIDKTIQKYSGLNEVDVIYTIKRHYLNADGKYFPENERRVAFIKQAYESGFSAEKNYRGCAQSTLIALGEITGVKNNDLFRAATAFSGGMSLCGDGVCGGYSGGLLFMSYMKGRDFDRIKIDGDKENQYFAYNCAQVLHDHYLTCYGSVICMNIHEEMFQGEHYILRTKPRRDEFEAAGAHTVVCTTVVGLACAWVAEILLDSGLYSIERER